VRVFLTGATGHVGSAVAEAFRAAGHEVFALVRSEAAAARVRAAGLTPVPGALGAPDGYAAAAAASDVLVHAAFEYDDAGAERTDVDERATVGLLAAARAGGTRDGRPRHLLYTSNAYLLRTGGGAPVDEDVDVNGPAIPPSWRFGVERRVLAADRDAAAASGGGASGGPPRLRTAVVRLGLVYGGAGGSGPDLFAAALRRGAGVYAGDGRSRWSPVYRGDLAALYLRIAEAHAGGVFHAVDGNPVTVADAARAVSAAAGFGGHVLALPPEAAAAELDAHTVDIMGRDVAVLPRRSLALGWRPRYASFREGAAAAFAEWRATAAAPPAAPGP
jgi:nucleoside-diphosphate-sugar epimerase